MFSRPTWRNGVAVTVVGNLPYYITSPIIEKTLALGSLLQRAIFLLQKEVAERVTARPGTRAHGFLSVQTQLLSTPELLFHVPASAFRPPPKVDSAVVRLIPKHDLPVADQAAFLHFVSLCFRQKRKKIRNNLLDVYNKSVLDEIPEDRAARRTIVDPRIAGALQKTASNMTADVN